MEILDGGRARSRSLSEPEPEERQPKKAKLTKKRFRTIGRGDGPIRVSSHCRADRVETLTEPPESWEVPKGETVVYVLDLTDTSYDIADEKGPISVRRIASSIVSHHLSLLPL
jgi:hypothetical protein